MSTHIPTALAEGQANNRPPLFSGTNYAYWKTRMRIYVQAIDYQIWRTIIKGPHIPMVKVDGVDIPKHEDDWNDHDIKMAELNAKAMNVLYCALDPNEFNRISTCTSAKEIWDKLEVTHEGTNQVKESKINMLVHNYELFKMDPNETITQMFTRFTDITNSLKSLGRTFPNGDLVRKILRSLPKNWDPKVTAIEEAKDLSTLPLDELLGSLLTHELKQHQDEEGRKKKGIALKAAAEEQEESTSSDEEPGNEEMALMVKRFRKFMGKGRPRFRRKFLAKGEPSKEKEKDREKEKEPPICYECKKLGHYRPECPLLKKSYKKKQKKKAMVATWSDSDESSSNSEEEEKVANICFMALEDEVISETEYEFIFEELQSAFNELMHEYKKAAYKNKSLKQSNDTLILENDIVSKKNTILQKELLNAKERKIAMKRRTQFLLKII